MRADDLKKSFKAENIEKMFLLEYRCDDICFLPNGLLASVSCFDHQIVVYDLDFSCTMRIKEIDGKDIQPIAITTDDIDSIYFTDANTNSVIKTDLQFNKIKSVDTKGRGKDKLFPGGLCYHDNILFVCDRYSFCLKHCIVLYSNDLIFITKINTDSTFDHFQVFGNTIAFKDDIFMLLQFFKIRNESSNKTLELITSYPRRCGRISILNDGFCEIDYSRKEPLNCMLYIYNRNGILTKKIEMNNEFQSYFQNNSLYDGLVFCINNEPYVITWRQRVILKLKVPTNQSIKDAV